MNKKELEDVKDTIREGLNLYGFDDKYVLSYFENIEVLEDFQLQKE